MKAGEESLQSFWYFVDLYNLSIKDYFGAKYSNLVVGWYRRWANKSAELVSVQYSAVPKSSSRTDLFNYLYLDKRYSI